MGQNMSRLEAVLFKRSLVFWCLEIAVVALLLWFLMALPFRVLSVSGGLLMPMAMLLSYMAWEDAFSQTVDLGLLFALACLMSCFTLFHGTAAAFFENAAIGACFFRFLLVSISFWLTCRSGSVVVPSHACEDAEDSGDRDDHLVGYLPIFMVTFILYIGLGGDFASVVFSQASFVFSAVKEIANFCPWILFVGMAVWAAMEGAVWWMEHRRGRQIVWAFGGGDVLFLGLFAGHIGFAPLLALYFLSLFTRVALAMIQFFLDGCLAAS